MLICMQVFVESLDRAFENVCELDLIFHFDEVSSNPFRKDVIQPGLIVLFQVHHVLSEIIQGGLVLETNFNEISTCGKPLLLPTNSFPALHLMPEPKDSE